MRRVCAERAQSFLRVRRDCLSLTAAPAIVRQPHGACSSKTGASCPGQAAAAHKAITKLTIHSQKPEPYPVIRYGTPDSDTRTTVPKRNETPKPNPLAAKASAKRWLEVNVKTQAAPRHGFANQARATNGPTCGRPTGSSQPNTRTPQPGQPLHVPGVQKEFLVKDTT
jgi:hypothetical protein